MAAKVAAVHVEESLPLVKSHPATPAVSTPPPCRSARRRRSSLIIAGEIVQSARRNSLAATSRAAGLGDPANSPFGTYFAASCPSTCGREPVLPPAPAASVAAAAVAAAATTPPPPTISSTRNPATADGEEDGEGASFGNSVFNLMNAIMGSGLLGLAYCARRTGIVLFLVLLSATAVGSTFGVHLLLRCCEQARASGYAEVGATAFGTRGMAAVVLAICLQNLGGMLSYMVLLGDILPAVLHRCAHVHMRVHASAGSEMSRQAVLCWVTLFVVLPLACLRRITMLGYASAACIGVMMSFVALLLTRAWKYPCPTLLSECLLVARQQHDLETQQQCRAHLQCDAWHFWPSTGGDSSTSAPASTLSVLEQAFDVLPTMAFAFVCHTTVLPVYNELSFPTRPRMQRVANSAIGACFIVYAVASIAGYLNFVAGTKPDILSSYDTWHPASYSCAMRTSLALTFALTVPLLAFPVRRNLCELRASLKAQLSDSAAAQMSIELPLVSHLLLTVTIIAVVLALALVCPGITVVFGIVGATSSVALVFVLPAVFFLRICHGTVQTGSHAKTQAELKVGAEAQSHAQGQEGAGTLLVSYWSWLAAICKDREAKAAVIHAIIGAIVCVAALAAKLQN